MIDVLDALEKVLNSTTLTPKVGVPLSQAAGRTLAAPALADRDHPPFHRVTMDGIALRWEDFEAGTRTFKILHKVMAGDIAAGPCTSGHAIQVMTGASLPQGTDTVVRVEDLHFTADEGVTVQSDAVVQGQNIHRQGIDALKGDTIVPAGEVLHAGHIAILATMGYSEVQVFEWPRVLVLATGQELVPVTENPLPHQIRQSNGWMLIALLHSMGIPAALEVANDDFDALTVKIKHHLDEHNIVITTGGVSMGVADYLPEVFKRNGVNEVFHKVAQRPGKPFWFGKYNNTLVFGLPGNPMSVLVTATFYLLPAIKKMIGRHYQHSSKAVLSKPIEFRPALTHFLAVSVHTGPDGRLWATPLQGHGSGDLIQMANLQGWVILPATRSHFEAGEVLEFLPLPSF